MKSVVRFLIQNKWLILTLLLALIPLMGHRLIRVTGDEKVYLAQALEMTKKGDWFVQVLGGLPNYYKGPLHYLMVRLGLKLFGLNLWAALYMNLVFLVSGALAVAHVIRSAFPSHQRLPYWAGCFFAFNVGCYGHFFTSQMEVELVGFFSLAYLALWRKKDLLFWVLAGLAGWAKSPLHSVLLGGSGVFYWLLQGSLSRRLLSIRSWVHVGVGVLICALGYAPAFILDTQNFIQHYIHRETFKGASGSHWWTCLVPMLSYFLWPWMSFWIFAIVGFVRSVGLGLWSWGNLSAERKDLWKLTLAGLLPAHLFFAFYHYRVDHYALPTLSAQVMLIILLMEQSDSLMIRLRHAFLALSSVLTLSIPICFQFVQMHFQFSSEVWPFWFLPLLWVLSAVFVSSQIRQYFLGVNHVLSRFATVGRVCLISMVGAILLVFGEMEIYPLREQFLKETQRTATPEFFYYAANDSIWNEWGLMSFVLRQEIEPIYHNQELDRAIRNESLILARNDEQKTRLLSYARSLNPSVEVKTFPWKRWRVLHLDLNGQALLLKAWLEKDLSVIMDDGVMLRFVSKRS